MSAGAPVKFSLDANRIGWITFDDPAARANVLTTSNLRAFADALEAAAKSDPEAVVIMSVKATTFVAGADLKQVAALSDAGAATEFSRAGQRLFARLAEFPVPVVCAIHGACAGGGYELALACHWRLATDAAVTRIGLPETGLGTIPGWGGGARLARLIGIPAAVTHLLQAKLLPASEAWRGGLIDEVVAERELKAQARATALKLTVTGAPIRPSPPGPPPEFFAGVRAQVLAKSRGRVPALAAVIDLAEQTAALSLADALDLEARAFGAVTAGPVCKNLLHAFFVREAARKQSLAGWFENVAGPVLVAGPAPSMSTESRPAGERPPCAIHRVGVVGAGVMGSGIAHWLAAHGCNVVLRDVQPDLVTRGLGVIRRLFDEGVKRGQLSADEADTGFARIRATTSWDGFIECDLVIEAVVENTAAKQTLFCELARVVRPDTLLASNTSALPIEEIAGHVPHPERTLGLHFFNPVSRMPLVELILGRATSAATAERAFALVKSLGKTPVVCRSSPGFLLTRVLFFYLNEAVRLWEDGVPTAVLDASLRDFGWPMGPLRLIDEVGIDVTDFIFDEMAHYFPDRFSRTSACRHLLEAGLKGRKHGAGRGFYRYESRAESANDEVTRALLPAPFRPNPSATESSGLCHLIDDKCAHLMGVMIAEARRCLAEGVVRSPDDVDFALLSGAGFPAFRGGLMRYAQEHFSPHSADPVILSAAKNPMGGGTRAALANVPVDSSLRSE